MRIAVIADIHGNLLALEAVLADARQFAPDLMVDLGDCVSGPLWPRETSERLETLALPTVRGNHDRCVAQNEPGTMWDSDRIAYEALTSTQRERLGALPETLRIERDILMFHATPTKDTVYLLDSVRNGGLVRAPQNVIAEKLSGFDAKIYLCGHSHRQEIITLTDGRNVLNPGSVGCPAYIDDRDEAHVSEAGTPHARYAIIDIAGGTIRNAMFRIVEYNHEAAALRALSYDQISWAHAVRTGTIPDPKA